MLPRRIKPPDRLASLSVNADKIDVPSPRNRDPTPLQVSTAHYCMGKYFLSPS